MINFRILGYSQVVSLFAIFGWLLTGEGNLYALVSPMMDLTKIVEYIYLGISVLLFPSIKLFLTAKALTVEQFQTARNSQNQAFIACLVFLLPAYSALAYPQLLVACVAGILSYPVMLMITGRYKKTMDQDS
jgi:hypothetical protein